MNIRTLDHDADASVTHIVVAAGHILYAYSDNDASALRDTLGGTIYPRESWFEISEDYFGLTYPLTPWNEIFA